MAKDDEPIEIKILNEPSAAPQAASPKVVSSEEVPPVKPETPTSGALSSAAQKVGQAAQNVAQKAWESEARKKISDKVGETAAKQKDAISEAVSKAVNDRIDLEKERMKRKIRETDWKEVAKKGAAAGLKVASVGLAKLSEKLKANSAADNSSSDNPPNEQ